MTAAVSIKVPGVILCVALQLALLNEVHAAILTSRVIPSEIRRQDLVQLNPCPGDMVEFTCTLNEPSATPVRWTIRTANGNVVFTFLPSDVDSMQQQTGSGLIATFVNLTTLTLLIDLSVSPSSIVNGTEVECIEVDDQGVTVNNATIVLKTIGLASPPSVQVRPGSLSTLTVDMTAPIYGRECVDVYRATAVVDGVTQEEPEPVTDPTQDVYSFVFSPSVDLCVNNLTNVTAVGITNGMEGSNAAPLTDSAIDRSTIITSPVSVSQFFNSAGINILLTWQVIDQEIFSGGFSILCLIEESVTSCPVNGTSPRSRSTLFSYDDDLQGRDVGFNVSYNYGICQNIPVAATLTIRNVNSSVPQVEREQRSVRVEFDETLFDTTSVRVMFLSTCTSSVTVDYSNPLVITIPNIVVNTGTCQYTIQLVSVVDSVLPVGYAISGVFDAIGLPSPPSPVRDVNVGAAAGGAVGGILFVIIIVGVTGGGGYAVVIHKKKRNEKKHNHELGEKEKLDEADGDPINHEQGPTGDEYALVDLSSKKKASASENPGLYQDPGSILHETAPTGDVYAITEKKQKKKGPTEVELAQMYSVPDKSKGAGLTYASLDMPGGEGSEAAKRPAPTEYATVVN